MALPASRAGAAGPLDRRISMPWSMSVAMMCTGSRARSSFG